MKKHPWTPTTERPKRTGIYEVLFQKGEYTKRFYTGLMKPAWIPIGSKSCMEDIEQPTHWRFCEDLYVERENGN